MIVYAQTFLTESCSPEGKIGFSKPSDPLDDQILGAETIIEDVEAGKLIHGDIFPAFVRILVNNRDTAVKEDIKIKVLPRAK